MVAYILGDIRDSKQNRTVQYIRSTENLITLVAVKITT